MPARWLVFVLALAITLSQAAGQCPTDPYGGGLATTGNGIASPQQPCFDALQVNFTGCDVRVTSTVVGCDWLVLAGTAASASSVNVSGPLSLDAADGSTFVLSIAGYYQQIVLAVDGDPSNQASYNVTSGRVLQVKAPLSAGPARLVNSESGTIAFTSTANCDTGLGAMTRQWVSKSCTDLLSDPCTRAYTVTVSGCRVFLASTTSDCARLSGSIQSAGTSVVLSVDYATNSLSQSAPGLSSAPGAATAPGLAKLRAGQGAGAAAPAAASGRKLLQGGAAVSWDQGATWGMASRTISLPTGDTLNAIVLRQSGCSLWYLVRSGSILGVGA